MAAGGSDFKCPPNPEKEGVIVTDPEEFSRRFKIYKDRQLGSGSFGQVVKGFDMETKIPVAIKVEELKEKRGRMTKVKDTSTYAEFVKYATLCPQAKKFGVAAGIIEVYLFTKVENSVMLVMEELGPNLDFLFEKCGRMFDVKTLCMVAVQLIDRIEFVHSCRILHRDIKPQNFAIGSLVEDVIERRNLIRIIDFGLAKTYVEEHQGVDYHIDHRQDKNLTGTARYVSIRTHEGHEQSRRDDIEAIAHLLIYFAKGKLPWQDQPKPKGSKAKNKYDNIRIGKKTVSIDDLCQGLPDPFCRLLRYSRDELDFEDKPDYDWMKMLFIDLFRSKGYTNDNWYSWDDWREEII